MSWPYLVALGFALFSAGTIFGAIVIGRLHAASRALEELDFTTLSRSRR